MLPTVVWSVGLPRFLLRWLTAMLLLMARLFSLPGLRMTSALVKRDGGTKLELHPTDKGLL